MQNKEEVCVGYLCTPTFPERRTGTHRSEFTDADAAFPGHRQVMGAYHRGVHG